MKCRLLLSIICVICAAASYAQSGRPEPIENPVVLTPQMLDGRQLLYEENNEYISHEYHFASDGTVEEYNYDYDYEHNMRYLVSTVTRRYEIRDNDIFILALNPGDYNEDMQILDHFRYNPLHDEIIRVY